MRRVLPRVLGGKPLLFTINTALGTGASFEVPTTGSGYLYNIDFGDGTVLTNQTGNASHTYATDGVYQIKITGAFPRFYFNNGVGKLKLVSIDQWGDVSMGGSQYNAFNGCSNLTSVALDASWTVNVTDMSNMFYNCTNFNSDLSSWSVQNVTGMNSMFHRCSSFNSDLSSWSVQNVTGMNSMFREAYAFNQDISNWDVSSVTDMSYMMNDTRVFNQSLAGWNIINVENMTGFKYAVLDNTISTSNYDATLIAWANLVVKNNVRLDLKSKYTLGGAAEVARNTLINTYGWTINDLGGI